MTKEEQKKKQQKTAAETAEAISAPAEETKNE